MAQEFDHLSFGNLSRILEIPREFAGTAELEVMLESVLALAIEILQADSGSIWLYKPERNKLMMELPAVDPVIEVNLGSGLVGECLATGIPISASP